MNITDGFSDFGGRVWLDCSHQGALPDVAAQAAHEAVAWKQNPRELTTERFVGVPARLRDLISQLIGTPSDEVILANGASYGLHLLANGLPLGDGDEVLLMAGDFPSDILPWLGLRDRGVAVQVVRPRRHVLTADEIRANISPTTRVLCMSWVHSFSGLVADVETIGTLCRERGITFIVNTTQGLGARRLDLSTMPVDAIVNAGWKWLCGPYATGFCWIRPQIRERLTTNQAYWQTLFTVDDLSREELPLELPPGHEARRYDLFATANFFNFAPWCAALELMLERGLERIESYDRELVAQFIDGLDRSSFDLLSPERDSERSTLVFISHTDPKRNAATCERLADEGIDIAYRRGALRISPHFYNSTADIDSALRALG